MNSITPQHTEVLAKVLRADAAIHSVGFHQAQREITALANQGKLKFVHGRAVGKSCQYYVATYYTFVDLFFVDANVEVAKDNNFYLKFDQTLMHIHDATDLEVCIPFRIYVEEGATWTK